MESLLNILSENWIIDIAGLAAVVTAIIGLMTYIKSKRIERIKVLLDLHQRFMDTDRYSPIRVRIEHSNQELLQMVKYAANHPDIPFDQEVTKDAEAPETLDSELMAKFDEYLAFFELLAHLWKFTKFQIEDIRGIFGYYLIKLKDVSEIWEYLNCEEFGFTVLKELIEEVTKYRNSCKMNT